MAAFWVFLFRTYARLPAAGRRPGAGGGALRRLLVAHARCGRRCCCRAAWPGWPARCEAAGPLGQLTPHVPAGYGFAAIIVAFVGRLHPVGVVFVGRADERCSTSAASWRSRAWACPTSLTGVFQGLLLFTLLACDTLIHYRMRWSRARAGRPASGKRR
ncbi:MAG: hypothetical protein MZW92_00850 [Comamonadaceae bacterium]|nr:hypothetical protein [Comamonadaceae bacterium]